MNPISVIFPFVKEFLNFVIDVLKYTQTRSMSYVKIPKEYQDKLSKIEATETVYDLLDMLVRLNASIKWVNNPKYDIEAQFLLFGAES